jgi:molybdate transport system ATP-binding protein
MERFDLLSPASQAEEGAVIDAAVEAHDDAFDLTLLRSRAGVWRLPRLALAPGEPLRLRVRARDVMLATKAPQGVSALNVVAGVVAVIGPEAGPVVDVRLDCSGETLVARLTRYSVAQLGLRPGTPVFALVKSVSFDRRSLSGLLRTGDPDDGVMDA